MSVYLQQLEDSNKPDIDTCLASIRREISMLFTIPNTIFNTLFEKKVLSLSECAFATCGLRFAEHFLNRYTLQPAFTSTTRLPPDDTRLLLSYHVVLGVTTSN